MPTPSTQCMYFIAPFCHDMAEEAILLHLFCHDMAGEAKAMGNRDSKHSNKTDRENEHLHTETSPPPVSPATNTG